MFNVQSEHTVLGGSDHKLEFANRDDVTLYFIAFKLVKEDGRMKHPLNIKNRQYNMPRLGGSFRVKGYVARDISDRLRVYDEKLGWVDGVTTNPAIAAAVREAFDRGSLKEVKDLNDIIQQGALASISIADLEAELARRKKAAGIVEETPVKEDWRAPVKEEKAALPVATQGEIEVNDDPAELNEKSRSTAKKPAAKES